MVLVKNRVVPNPKTNKTPKINSKKKINLDRQEPDNLDPEPAVNKIIGRKVAVKKIKSSRGENPSPPPIPEP